MDDIKLNVASNMLRLRAEAGMTQSELGSRLNYSDKAVSKWERGESVPDVAVLKQIADMFGVTVDYLISSHDEWEAPVNKKKELSFRPKAVILVSAFGIITAAVLTFVIFWVLDKPRWDIFIYTVPLALITVLVLNTLWNRQKGNLYIVAAIVLSLFAVTCTIIYLTMGRFLWQIFLVAIPAEIVTVLCFYIKKKKHG